MKTCSTQLRRLWIVTLCAVWVIYPGLAQAQLAIGNAQKVVNVVNGTVAQQTRKVAVNDEVFQNENIQTGAESATHLVFQDETTVSVGAQSQLTLDKFVFDPDPAKSAVFMSMTLGVFRFTSGKMATSAYIIKTPTAVIGIRGTVVEIIVLADGTTIIRVIGGAITVTAANVTVIVDAGFQTSVPPGQPPGPPTPLSPTPPMMLAMYVLLGEPERGAPAGARAPLYAGDKRILLEGGALAALLGIGLGLLLSEDDDRVSVTTTTTTTTTTSTNFQGD